MLAGDVITLAADGSLERRHVGSVAAAVRPRRGGGAVIGLERGFALEDADGTLTALPELWNDPAVRMNQVTVSNGFEWSPDGSRVYYNDTATFTISVFDYDTAAGLTNRRMFAELPEGGRPDGLTVDAEGGVWTAVSKRRAVNPKSTHRVL